MNTTIGIFGASGFVGREAVSYFVNAGDTVKAFGRTEPNFNEDQVENSAIDYSSREQVVAACKGIDVLIVLIGIEYKTKTWATLWPLYAEHIRGAIEETGIKCIFLDNVYSYGLVDGVMTEASPLNPCSKKGHIRKEVVLGFQELIDNKHNVVIARSADFYGPRVETSAMSDRFHKLIRTKNTFEWLCDTEPRHSFTYVPDIAPALYQLAHADVRGVYHLPTSNENMSGEAIKEILESYTGKQLKVSLLTKGLARVIGLFMPVLRELIEMMYQYENDYIFDSSKILAEFPELTVTPFKKGIIHQYDSWNSRES